MEIILTAKKVKVISWSVFLSFVFIICLLPLNNNDIWFHLKSGEYFATHGLVFYDVFSYTAQGRQWIPYEWLFQVGVYYCEKILGLRSIIYLTAFMGVLQVGTLVLILRRVFNLNLFFSFFCGLLFLSSTLEFVSSRPHTLAYAFLIINIYSLLYYYFDEKINPFKFSFKNILLINIPLILIWTNIHGSVFLAPSLFLAFSAITLLNYFLFKHKKSFQKSLVYLIGGIIGFTLTILPPLGFGQYELLWKFYQYREVLTTFIQEWVPLYNSGLGYYIYLGVNSLIVVALIVYLFVRKVFLKNLWLLIILPFPFLAYLAARNIVIGYIALVILLGWLLSKIDLSKLSALKKRTLWLVLLLALLGQLWLIYSKRTQQRLYYPVNAVQFIKQYDLQGNMFNEYGYGGYLLYELYPKKLVFFDGRTEMYLCCEMPDVLQMSLKKHQSDLEYQQFLDQLWNKYNVSYILFRTEKQTVFRKVGRILTDDPKWALVFWDDDSELFIRKDGENNQIIKSLEVKAATPYNQNPYREGMEDQAFEEYQRMINIVDSSKSRNAIGFILLKKGKFTEAALEFQKAIQLDSSNESPLMNLAELAAKDKNYNLAVELYEKALPLAPDRGLIYIRLGQLYLQNEGDLVKAKAIWQKGAENTVDEDAKRKLQELLQM